MPTKNNHINVNVKNVIKLDHNKKKTRRRRKNKNNKNIMPLARPNNSVYNPNAITYQTGGSIQYPINKSGYDMKPRIGFGIDPNSDTTSTNMTQQLLLEHQKQNDNKTKQMLLEHHENLKDGFNAYHETYYQPLVNDYNNLKSDFNKFKIDQIPELNYDSDYPISEFYTNILPNDDTNLKGSNNSRFEEYNPVYNEVMLNQPENIYNSNNADNIDTNNDHHPILTSNNADNFSPPPFDEFVSNNFSNPNLNKDFEVQSVDEEDEEDELPKTDAVVETKMIPQYLSLINNLDIFKFINTNEGLNIDTNGMKNDELRKKIIEKLKLAGKKSSIVYVPADKLSERQMKDGEKIQKILQKKGKK